MNDLKEMSSFKSEARLDMLKERTKRCVCKFCGNKLRLKRIIFSSYEEVRVEIFCEKCNRIEFGVEPEINILLRKASYMNNYSTVLFPVPHGASITEEGTTNVTSQTLKDFIKCTSYLCNTILSNSFFPSLLFFIA